MGRGVVVWGRGHVPGISHREGCHEGDILLCPRGSLCCNRVEVEVRKKHSELYSYVIWDGYEGEWKRFILAHPEHICLEYDHQRGVLPWRIRLSDSDAWIHEDVASRLAQEGVKRTLCVMVHQMIQRSPDRGIRLMDLKKVDHHRLFESETPKRMPPLSDWGNTLLESHQFILDGDVLHRRRVMHGVTA